MINKDRMNKWLQEQQQKYPDQRSKIHSDNCPRCPSKDGGDEETMQYASLPKEVLATDYVFACAWRQEKLCKGICDIYGIDEGFIRSLKPCTPVPDMKEEDPNQQ